MAVNPLIEKIERLIMDKLQEFLDMGGEIRIGKQDDRYVLSVHGDFNGDHYAQGIYFKDCDHLLYIMDKDGNWILSAIRAYKLKIRELL